jgi:hypothetical protein
VGLPANHFASIANIGNPPVPTSAILLKIPKSPALPDERPAPKLLTGRGLYGPQPCQRVTVPFRRPSGDAAIGACRVKREAARRGQSAGRWTEFLYVILLVLVVE